MKKQLKMSALNGVHCRLCDKLVPGLPNSQNWKMHVAGKKHLSQLPTSFITVEGLPPGVDLGRVNDHFGRYGTVTGCSVKLEEGWVTYVFKDFTCMTEVVQDDHVIEGAPVVLSWVTKGNVMKKVYAKGYEKKRKKEKKAVEGGSGGGESFTKLMLTTFAKTLGGGGSKKEKMPLSTGNRLVEDNRDLFRTLHNKPFMEQIHIIHQTFKPTPQSRREEQLIYDNLDSAISPVYPLARIHFFGVRKIGIATYGNVKCYIDNVKRRDQIEQDVLTEIVKLVTEMGHFTTGNYSRNNAGTTVIKAKHYETGVTCEINIKNVVPVYHTDLVRYYLSLDDKLPVLMTCVKFWVQCYSLNGSVSSYVLSLLVIFYLQHDYKLPSVAELQSISKDKTTINGWNCKFEFENFCDSTVRTTTLLDMFLGFFSFYAKFDYFCQVVCPFYGKDLPKSDFVNRSNLPDCFEDYKNIAQDRLLPLTSSLCVQDVFQHNVNVSSAINPTIAVKFVKMCKEGLKFSSLPETEILPNYLKNCVFSGFAMQHTFEIEKSASLDDKLWATLVRRLIRKALTDVLYCDVKKSSRTNDSFNFWCKGKLVEHEPVVLAPTVDSVFLEDVYKAQVATKFYEISSAIDVLITAFFKDSPVKAVVYIRQLQASKHFSMLSHFLELKLSKWMKLVEEEFSDENLLLFEDETREVEVKAEEEEEDVPDDFFDELLNEDFIEDLALKEDSLSSGEIRSDNDMEVCEAKEVVKGAKSRSSSSDSSRRSRSSSLTFSSSSSYCSRRRGRKRRKRRRSSRSLRPKLTKYEELLMEEIKEKLNPVTYPEYASNYPTYTQYPANFAPPVESQDVKSEPNEVPHVALCQTLIPIETQPMPTTADVTKNVEIVFGEKKISLCDFLTIAKKTSEPPRDFDEKKVKVLRRCEEVIRLMTLEDRFVVRPGTERRRNSLKTNAHLKFSFTTPSPDHYNREKLGPAIVEILHKVGIDVEVDDLNDIRDRCASVRCADCKKKLCPYFDASTQVDEEVQQFTYDNSYYPDAAWQYNPYYSNYQ